MSRPSKTAVCPPGHSSSDRSIAVKRRLDKASLWRRQRSDSVAMLHAMLQKMTTAACFREPSVRALIHGGRGKETGPDGTQRRAGGVWAAKDQPPSADVLLGIPPESSRAPDVPERSRAFCRPNLQRPAVACPTLSRRAAPRDTFWTGTRRPGPQRESLGWQRWQLPTRPSYSPPTRDRTVPPQTPRARRSRALSTLRSSAS